MRIDPERVLDIGGKLGVAAVAGVAGTLAYKAVSSLLGADEGEIFEQKKRTEDAVVDKVSGLVGWKPSRTKRYAASRSVKYVLGIGTGVATALLRRKVGATDSLWRGALFNAAIFVLANEVLKPAIGAQGKPTDYPLSTHAKALAGHTAYGLANAGTRRMLQRRATR